MMQKIIGVTELQRQFRSFFDQVVKKNMRIVLTRGSRPEAVLIPYEEYLRYQQLQESEVRAVGDSDLLVLHPFGEIAILRPAEFLALL